MNPTRRVRVLLVENHQMVRQGLQALLARDDRIEIVGEAEDGKTAVALGERLRPDVVVMDVGLPGTNGIEATRRLKASAPEVRVLALSAYSDRRYVANMVGAGASGYVLKDAASEELLRGVLAVAGGSSFLSPEVTGGVLEAVGRVKPQAEPRDGAFSLLGARERQVLQLLAEGLTSARIAERLHISSKTVESHRRNLMHKLGLHSVAELTKYAVREGLTSLDR